MFISDYLLQLILIRLYNKYYICTEMKYAETEQY